jgi:hypothetical protein
LDHEQFAEAVERLTPAAPVSWCELLTEANADSSFLAFFVADADDPPVDDDDARFRQLLRA